MVDFADVILFLHIPKTAGSTVHLFFESQLAPAQWYTLNSEGRDPFEEYANLPDAVKQPLRVVKGHMQFGIHEVVGKPCAYVTLLRNPVDRIVSNYYFALAHAGHYLHREASRMTLEEFSTSELTLELDNLQVRLLAGRMYLPFGGVRDADLQLANDQLRSHFAVVGHQEDVPGFLATVAAQFGLRDIGVKSQNITPKRPALVDVPDSVKIAIEKRNHLDMELYRTVMKTQPRTWKTNVLKRWVSGFAPVLTWAN